MSFIPPFLPSSEASYREAPDPLPADIAAQRRYLVAQATRDTQFSLRLMLGPIAAPEQTAKAEIQPSATPDMPVTPVEAPVAAAEVTTPAVGGDLDIETIRAEVAKHAASSTQAR